MSAAFAMPQIPATDLDLLFAARDGDDAAFARLTQPLQREIHVHCYRMLGSLDDADDALQETMIRAWRRLETFEPRAPFRAWLYRIATNVCLTALSRRDRHGLAHPALEETEVTDARFEGLRALDGVSAADGEPIHLDPYPDRLPTTMGATILNPELAYERQEHVELAFVAAVQLLPARQRATLLLRDVIGYSAAEVAAMLETSVAGVNSILQRARATLDQERARGRVARSHLPGGTATEQALVRRLADAWHAVDVPAIIALLTDDAVFTMPPMPLRFQGHRAIAELLRTVPAGGQLNRFHLSPTRANGQPALATYYRETDHGPFHAYGMLVVSVQGDAIASLTRFRNPAYVTRAGLPETIEG